METVDDLIDTIRKDRDFWRAEAERHCKTIAVLVGELEALRPSPHPMTLFRRIRKLWIATRNVPTAPS